VTPTQIVLGVAIIVVLVSLSGYYAWRQWQTLRSLRSAAEMAPGEYTYLRNQAWRRLAGSALMLLFAGLFVGVFFFEPRATQLLEIGEAARARNEQAKLDPAQSEFFHFYVGYVIVLLLMLLALIGLAGYELFAIRRFGLQNYRRIQAERRAMIARETARLRSQRNGPAS
jgi:uncharacterized membrane protein